MYVFICIHSYLKYMAHIYVCNNRIIYNLIFCVKENLKVVEDRKTTNSIIQRELILSVTEKC